MTKEDLLKSDSAAICVVDIREPGELAMLPPLPGSINIPLQQLSSAVAQNSLPHNKTILTVCASGGRCHAANAFLKEAGFVVDYLEGGLLGN